MFPLPAGMPTVTFSDAAALRLETISFFLLVFLLSAWGVKGLGNLLRRDWSSLPRLTYRAALGLTGLWGLLFVLVLTMISGTRELLTPGAWEKHGLTYRLKEKEAAATAVADPSVEDRRRHLEELGRALLAFAAMHDGRFPGREETTEIDKALWRLPNRPASSYVYLPGGIVAEGRRARIIAFEPAIYDDDAFVLMARGEVTRLSRDDLADRLDAQEAP